MPRLQTGCSVVSTLIRASIAPPDCSPILLHHLCLISPRGKKKKFVSKATPKNILHHYLCFSAHSQLSSGEAGPAVVLVFLGTAVSQNQGRGAWIKACYGDDEKDVSNSLVSHQNVQMQTESSSALSSPSLSAQHPHSLANRGWILCTEPGSRGVFKADFFSCVVAKGRSVREGLYPS